MINKRYLDAEETTENHERWLVSYADFITLLFAFFVVMYALSSVNEGKYRVLSRSLVNAFSTSASPILLQSETSPITLEQSPLHLEKQIELPIVLDEKKASQIKKQKKMKQMAKDIILALEPLVQDGKVRVTQNALGIAVEINASVLFSPGQAQLAESSTLSLRAVAQVVKDHDHEIHIEGHTDNTPIYTDTYPSNWELSTARASSVIRLFIDNEVAADRMTAIGYADNRPIETNATLEGRKRNRRVAVMILSNEPEQVTEIPVSLDVSDTSEVVVDSEVAVE
ncbi:MAG: flagellar motor protein MotD [Nitrosomonas sp.]|nr:flagellar motor protein MotD [Nitrosomonas sp.]